MALANINVAATPAGPMANMSTPYSNTTVSQYGGTHTFKVPVTVVFMTGMSLVLVNSIVSGRISGLFTLVWNGKAIANPWTNYRTLIGEVMFVMIVSFLSEINGAIADISFALFIALWMVWSMNNTSTIASWTSNVNNVAGTGGNNNAAPAAKGA